MNLTLLLTARCNASCAHCSTNCGPYRTESLSREQIFSLMDQAVALSDGEVPEFYLTGGEPFLDFPLLLEVVAHGKQLGALVTCVTNGYWATSEEQAQSMLSAIKEAGLTELAVSRSRFHEPYVSQKRIERVLGASRVVGLPCTVKNVRMRSDRENRKAVSAWALAAGAVRTQEMPLMPRLREGASVPETEYARRKGLPRGRCPAAVLSVREDGQAYTCCQPGSFNQFLALGSTGEHSLRTLCDRYYLGGAQQILRHKGPIHFARAIQAKGLGGRLQESYTNVCDLCTHITSDPELAAIASETARTFEAKQLERILAPAVRQSAGGTT